MPTGIQPLLEALRTGRISESGRQALRDAGYHVGERDAYPVAISRPPAHIGGLRVTGWAETPQKDGCPPGGYVLAEDTGAGLPDRYLTGTVHTRDGGVTWHVTWAGPYTGFSLAWETFTAMVAGAVCDRELAALIDTA